MIYKYFLKRLFDLLVTTSALLLLAPVILLLVLIIRIKLGKSVFFLQERGGLNGTIFRIIKFRTMNNKCDENNNLLPDDQRLTKFGKFLRSSSLDELPSLINVLCGQMSLVGPRPFIAEYLPYYNTHQKQRHLVKPGITGWAQVNGRNALTWEQKFELDIWYVKHQTFLLDLKILWHTLAKVLNRKDINSAGHATMPKFSGTNLSNNDGSV